jgi:hypothetical protein
MRVLANRPYQKPENCPSEDQEVEKGPETQLVELPGVPEFAEHIGKPIG